MFDIRLFAFLLFLLTSFFTHFSDCSTVLSNAIKFTKRGSVDIEMVGLPLPAEPDSSPKAQRVGLRCTVKDTGLGISPAQLATLFKSFSQSVGRPARARA